MCYELLCCRCRADRRSRELESSSHQWWNTRSAAQKTNSCRGWTPVIRLPVTSITSRFLSPGRRSSSPLQPTLSPLSTRPCPLYKAASSRSSSHQALKSTSRCRAAWDINPSTSPAAVLRASRLTVTLLWQLVKMELRRHCRCWIPDNQLFRCDRHNNSSNTGNSNSRICSV